MRGRTLALVVLLALTTGCGDSSPATKGKAPPELLFDQAMPVAKAGTLRPADLPGYTAAKADDTETGSTLEHDFDTCIDSQALTVDEPVATYGREFEKGMTSVLSGASVARSSEQARTLVTALRKPATAPCFENVFTYMFSKEGVTATKFSGRAVPLALKGADAVFAMQFTMRLAKEGATLRLSGRWVSAATGPAVVDVIGLTINGDAIPLARARDLLARAVGRAKAARQKV